MWWRPMRARGCCWPPACWTRPTPRPAERCGYRVRGPARSRTGCRWWASLEVRIFLDTVKASLAQREDVEVDRLQRHDHTPAAHSSVQPQPAWARPVLGERGVQLRQRNRTTRDVRRHRDRFAVHLLMSTPL